MEWCDGNGVDYIFGLPGNAVLDRLVEPAADDVRVRRAEGQLAALRGFAETCYAAKSWDKERRVVARIEASASHEDDMLRKVLDIRYVVTSLQEGDAEHIYETVYCARGQAENLIKQHKAQLASDRTSCRSPLANQMRLILHTGAYWLLLDVRDAIPSWNPLWQHRVRNHPLAPPEDRRPHHRNDQLHSRCARLLLSRGRVVQLACARTATIRTMKHGARAPSETRIINPERVDSVYDLIKPTRARPPEREPCEPPTNVADRDVGRIR